MALNTKTIPMSGKLITSVDETQIGDNFSIVENLRYDPTFKGIKGMTKINTTPLADLDIKSGHHFKKTDPQQESHVLVQSFTGSTSKLYDNTSSIPNQGNFTALHTDASGSVTGRFANTPVESVVYCNGEESLIWSGDRFSIGAFLIASTDDTKSNFILTNRADYSNHTQKIRNNITADKVLIPDSAEVQLFIGATQKIKGITFNMLSGSPDRYSNPNIQYYNGSSWISVTNLIDTTSVLGFTLKQSGSYFFDDTQNIAKSIILDSIQLFWYRITFDSYNVVAGSISISHVDISSNIQSICDLWDGGDVPLVLLKREEGNDVVNITENNYDTNNNATWVSLRGSFNGNSIELPDNIQSATGISLTGTGDMFILSNDELIIYKLDRDGDIISQIDISPLYVSSADGLPLSIEAISVSVPTAGNTSHPFTSTPRILITGTKKTIEISARGKVISSFLNTSYDISAGNAVGITQSWISTTQEMFWLVDETTSKLYSLNSTFVLINTYSLPFIPSDITHNAFNNTNRLFIYEKNNKLAHIYSTDGTLISTINTPNNIISGSRGHVLYDPTDTGSGKPVISIFKGGIPNRNPNIEYTNKRLLIGSFQRLAGIKINLIPCNTNVSADPSLVKVRGNSNISNTPVELSGIIDRTRSDDFEIPFNQSGSITWTPIPENEEVQISIDGLSIYTYEITLAATILADIKAYYMAGISAQKTIQPYSFPVLYKERLCLCDQTKDKRNSILVGALFTDNTFNGSDSIELFIGDSLPIISGTSVTKGLIVCKHSETWLVSGDNPDNFTVKNISKEIGCSDPLTMKSVDLKTPDGSLLQVAVWRDTEGVYISEGQSITKVSFDVESLFRSDSLTGINNIGISNAFFDVTNKEYHLLYPEIGSNTVNKEIVFDIEHKVWYTINRQSKILSIGFIANDTLGNYVSYGGDNSGQVYRLENGTTFDGNDIIHVLKTGDIRLTGENVIQTILRRVNLLQKAKNTTANKINGAHFGDTSTSGGSFTMDIAETGKRVKISRADVNFGINTFHSIKLSMATNNEINGFEPLEMVLYFIPARKDKI